MEPLEELLGGLLRGLLDKLLGVLFEGLLEGLLAGLLWYGHFVCGHGNLVLDENIAGHFLHANASSLTFCMAILYFILCS